MFILLTLKFKRITYIANI